MPNLKDMFSILEDRNRTLSFYLNDCDGYDGSGIADCAYISQVLLL